MPVSVIAFMVSSLGFARIVSAAALTAFWSRGVNARSACWMRLPSWPSTVSGTSSGFCVTQKYAHALRADEAHHLFDLVQLLRSVGEQQVRLVEEEDQLGPVPVADLEVLVELGEQPEQQRRVELRRVEQLVRSQDVDDPAAGAEIGLDQVVGSPTSRSPPCCSTPSRPRWIAPTAPGRHVAVARLELLRMVADVLQHCPQVLEVEQQQAIVVGDLEHQRQHAQFGDPREQQGAQIGECRPDGVPVRRRHPRRRPASRRTGNSLTEQRRRSLKRPRRGPAWSVRPDHP